MELEIDDARRSWKSTMQVTASLIAAGNKLLLKIHGNKSTSKEVIHIPSYRSEVIYGGTWFSNSRGVVCKMLKQAIWKVLSKRVVSDSGDKLLLPCLYLPTTSFHAGQFHCSPRSFFGVEDFLDDDNSKPYTYQKGKKSKNPNKHVSFKQRTEAYMEPFTLDVFISKRFVSASVTHRVTCKQVAVAGTNSKDIKAVLRSRSDIPACLAIGRILAERAREADVYTASYTPRERDKFEGKIRAVVQSLIDNGIDIKVYLD